MALKEYKAEKLLYTMGEVTEMFDVKPSLIRFWEQRFDVLKPKKNKKGNRLFTPADVETLEVIYHLTKERGMTLAGVEKYLKTNRGEAQHEAELMRRLQAVRSLLVEIREELKEEGEGEVRVFTAPVSEAMPEAPNPEEFTEEVLPGEIVEEEPEPDDFWSEEQPVEELREEEERQKEEPLEEMLEESDFEGYTDEKEEDWGGTWEEEEEIPDAEVTVPFTAQPLFELEETAEPASEETEEVQPEPESPSLFDTQQSLF